MSDTHNNKPHFNDGQALTPADLEAITNQMRAFLLDQIIGGMAVNYIDNIIPSSPACYVPRAAHGAPVQGGAPMTVVSTAGYVCQSTGGPDGLTPQLLAYRLAANEINVTLPAADPSNNRYDGIFIKITDNVPWNPQSRDFQDAVTGALSSQTVDVNYQTTLSVQVVSGATSSGIPSFPATPSGYVPWAYVAVQPAFSGYLTPDMIFDVRYPMRFGAIDVPAKAFLVSDPSHATIDNQGSYFNLSGAAGYTVDAVFPFGPDARVLGWEVHGEFTDPGSSAMVIIASGYDLSSFPYNSNTFPPNVIAGPNNSTTNRVFSSSTPKKKFNLDLFSSQGVVMWGNGYSAGMAGWALGNNYDAHKGGLLVEVSSGGGTHNVSFVRFFYAY